MGKRKAAAKKPTGPRKNEPLPTVFPCLFCNHEKSVIVKLDKKAGVGNLNCKVCNQQFQCAINYLSSAVDVYADWVDACDAVAKLDGEEEEQNRSVSRTLPGNASTPRATLKRQSDHQGSSHEKRVGDARFAGSSVYQSRLPVRIDDDY